MDNLDKESEKKFIEGFDGEILHPAIDFRAIDSENHILTLGFRYLDKDRKEREVFLVGIKDNIIKVYTETSFEYNGKRYFFDTAKRRLPRLDERWDIDKLNKFLYDYENVTGDYLVSEKEIFQSVENLVRKYTELEEDIDYIILTAWIIGTYFYIIFPVYPFLHIKGPKGSGKTQTLNLLKLLCFNSIKTSVTLASLCDTLDSLRGTLLIDQADSLNRKGKEEIVDILTDSYKRGGGKRRIVNYNKTNGREILEFDTYGPKAFASTDELPEDLKDRCIIIPLVRSYKNFPEPDNESEDWREIRGNLYKLLLTNYDYLATVYSIEKTKPQQNSEISGRKLELWLPIEVILNYIGSKNEEEIKLAKQRFLSLYGFSEYEPSELEKEVIEAILMSFGENEEIILSPKEISEKLPDDIFYEKDTIKQRAARVGWVIKKFNLASEKKSRTKNGISYLFQKSRIEKVYQTYFSSIKESIEDKENLSSLDIPY